MKIEIRSDSVAIEGYVNAVARDSRELPSPRGRFVEQILPTAWEKAIGKAEDIKLLFNHKENRELGSIKQGNLELFEDNIGLRAICTIYDEEVMQKAKDKKLTGWSFGFIPRKDKWEEFKDGVRRRFIQELDLLEVSILDKTPAYIGTSIETRGEETLIREIRNEEMKVVISDSTPKETIQEIEERVEPEKVDYTLPDLELYTLKGGKKMRKELEERRNDLISELETSIEKAKLETRSLNEEELDRAEEIKKEIRTIDETAKAEEELRNLEVEKPKGEKRMEKNLVEKLMAGQEIDLSKEERATTEAVATGGHSAVGGQLVGKTFADAIVKKLPYISPLYGAVNKIITSQPHQIPIQNTKIGKFVKTAELGDYVAQNAAYNVKTLNAVKYTNMFVVSKELLQDSMYDIEGELIGQTIEALGTTLDELIVKGNATDGIEGLENLATANGAKQATCSTVKAITTDDIVSLFYALPVQYRSNAVWIFNDNTAQALAKLVTTDKKPLMYTDYSASPVGGQTMILGRPVIINNNVADVTATTASKAVFFVDLSRAMTVGVRNNFEMVRSTEFGFLNDSVAVKSSIRLDCKTLVEEAAAFLLTKIA